jgi:hypothetical protein
MTFVLFNTWVFLPMNFLCDAKILKDCICMAQFYTNSIYHPNTSFRLNSVGSKHISCVTFKQLSHRMDCPSRNYLFLQ